jgi:hypothetical protein
MCQTAPLVEAGAAVVVGVEVVAVVNRQIELISMDELEIPWQQERPQLKVQWCPMV